MGLNVDSQVQSRINHYFTGMSDKVSKEDKENVIKYIADKTGIDENKTLTAKDVDNFFEQNVDTNDSGFISRSEKLDLLEQVKLAQDTWEENTIIADSNNNKIENKSERSPLWQENRNAGQGELYIDFNQLVEQKQKQKEQELNNQMNTGNESNQGINEDQGSEEELNRNEAQWFVPLDSSNGANRSIEVNW